MAASLLVPTILFASLAGAGFGAAATHVGGTASSHIDINHICGPSGKLDVKNEQFTCSESPPRPIASAPTAGAICDGFGELLNATSPPDLRRAARQTDALEEQLRIYRAGRAQVEETLQRLGLVRAAVAVTGTAAVASEIVGGGIGLTTRAGPVARRLAQSALAKDVGVAIVNIARREPAQGGVEDDPVVEAVASKLVLSQAAGGSTVLRAIAIGMDIAGMAQTVATTIELIRENQRIEQDLRDQLRGLDRVVQQYVEKVRSGQMVEIRLGEVYERFCNPPVASRDWRLQEAAALWSDVLRGGAGAPTYSPVDAGTREVAPGQGDLPAGRAVQRQKIPGAALK